MTELYYIHASVPQIDLKLSACEAALTAPNYRLLNLPFFPQFAQERRSPAVIDALSFSTMY